MPDRFGSSTDTQLRNGALGSMRLDPLHVLASMGAVTEHLGLAATVSTTYAQPFTVARSFASLDHLTAGRAAWNVVTSFQESEARNFNRDEQFPPRDKRYERADEFLEVAAKLWDSWEDDALVLDTEAPLFADPAKVHAIDHKGEWFTVQGPLNVPRPPQGYPVVIQAGASSKGKDFAARWSDVIFCSHASLESAQDFYREIKERVAAHGRDPRQVKILPSIAPVVGATNAIARQTFEELFELVPSLGGLSTLAYHLDVDLSTFPLDERLPDVEVPGVEGHYREVREITEREGLTLRELGKQYGGGRVEGGFIGTATEVADGLEEWFTGGACDGFMVQAPTSRAGSRTSRGRSFPNCRSAACSAPSTRAPPCGRTSGSSGPPRASGRTVFPSLGRLPNEHRRRRARRERRGRVRPHHCRGGSRPVRDRRPRQPSGHRLAVRSR